MQVTPRPPLVFARGRGSWLWDSEERPYLDLVQGWAVNTLGHCAPALVEAITAQAARLLHPGAGVHNERAPELAQRLAGLSGLDRCFFTNSGAEANEGAIKLARKFGRLHRGGAHEIITFEHGFHGRTLATMSASGKPGFDRLFAPQVPGFPKARLNELASVEALVSRDTVAVMLEPIQGEAGVIEAEPAFLRSLRALCDAHGLLLVFDEVQTGVGRTGRLWGHEEAGVRPDIMTLGKGLGGGVPIGALLAREAVCCFEPGDQGGTYNGNPLVCAAALAVLDAVTAPGFLPAVQARGRELRAGLDRIAARTGGAPARGRGLLLALDLPGADAARQAAEQGLALAAAPGGRGLLLNAVRPQRLRLMPALDIAGDEVALALELLERCLPAR
ncbi:aminotransferase class III-fold pyridoxal phosphate-dependent enzyme [Caldimonas tepidiphila]|uniref:aminotransferase class III-fold pyridoxal phosphate-dependent enzyme n=1 Tax=Caldimonas tepidiphila TaxID=2315841 RepID=UPI001F0BB65B|nr:aminotransferase class III-fold pyridoxal phosphate-dependent enzyme [Caldimonas tepidiphila]